MGFVVYDVETSGLAKGFDQILQFAAVHADPNLVELDAWEIRSRLLPHVVPAPGALHVTGIGIDDLLDPTRPSHYEMVCAIRETLARWCPAAFLGFNSIRFDEEFLRQAFYQCLHPPYLTNTRGSSRADVLHLMRAVHTLDPDALKVPLAENGRPMFKLDRLLPANGLSNVDPHDALADARATLALCRLARDGAPDTWSRFVRFAQKAAVLAFLEEEEAFLVFEFFGARQATFPVAHIGNCAAQPNVAYCLDLTADLSGWAELDDEALVTVLQHSPRPVRRIRTNAAPTLCPLWEAPPRLLRGLDEADLLARAGAARADPALLARVVRLCEAAEPTYEPAMHVELQLYEGGFWSDADARRLEWFHTAPWEKRPAIVGALEDARLRRLGRRLIYFERPDLLAESQRTATDREIARRLLGEEGAPAVPWLTVPKALTELAELVQQISDHGLERLVRYGQHLTAQAQNLARILN